MAPPPIPPPVTEAPPDGSPWYLPFADCPFALFDLEMTGTDPTSDAIVEVAVTRVVGTTVVARFETTLRSDIPSQPASLAVHGISSAESDASPAFSDIASALATLFRGAVPVAHGTALDLPFINRAFASAGMPDRVTHALDTVTLARRALHARSYALGALAARLGLGPHRWHRAGEDVRALVSLFHHLTGLLAPESARDLWEVRVGQRCAGSPVVRAAIARRVAALEATGKPCTVVVRTPGRDPVSLRGHVRRVNGHATVTPGTAQGPGAIRWVRLDRILRVEP